MERKTIIVMEGDQTGQELLEEAGCRAIYEATFESVLEGTRTAEMGGSAGTREFTDEAIRHVKNKLEVWSALA